MSSDGERESMEGFSDEDSISVNEEDLVDIDERPLPSFQQKSSKVDLEMDPDLALFIKHGGTEEQYFSLQEEPIAKQKKPVRPSEDSKSEQKKPARESSGVIPSDIFDIEQVAKERDMLLEPQPIAVADTKPGSRALKDDILNSIMRKMNKSHEVQKKPEFVVKHKKRELPLTQVRHAIKKVFVLENIKEGISFNQISEIIKNSKSSQEIEMSFGTFFYNGNQNNFTPGLSYYDISKIKDFVKLKKLKYSEKKTVDTVTILNDMNIRKIEDEKNNKTYEYKNRVRKLDFSTLGIRLSVSEEKNIDQTQIDEFDEKMIKGVNHVIRHRERISYTFKKESEYAGLRLDITKIIESRINITKSRENIHKNEVEIEILNKDDDDIAKKLVKLANRISLILNYPSYNYESVAYLKKIKILSKDEIKFVVKNHNLLFETEIEKLEWKARSPFTLYSGFWNKPINVSLIDLLVRNDHAITVKYDGTRSFLFLFNQKIYLLNYPSSVYQVGCLGSNGHESLYGTILDGELMSGPDGLEIYIFDILFYKKKDIRKMIFDERMKCLDELFINLNRDYETYFEFIKKKYNTDEFYSNFEKSYFEFREVDKYKKDGLILQSRDSYLNSNTYKWKPSKDITIDFILKLNRKLKKGMGVFDLYVYNVPKNILYEKSVIMPLAIEKVELDDKIVECSWDSVEKTYKPYRIRYDRYQPNNKSTADNIKKEMLNPILAASLMGRDLVLMRKYHNYLKMRILQSEFGDRDTIIDIGSGRGGDLGKWKKMNFKKIFAIEPDEKNIDEFKSRLMNTNLEDRITIIKGGAENTDLIKHHIRDFVIDGMVSFFSMTFFPENEEKYENFLKTIDLIPFGGKFVGIVMCGERVIKEMREKTEINYDEFTIKTISKNKDSHIGNMIEIDIKDGTSMVKNQRESLFFFRKFVQDMKEKDFHLLRECNLDETMDHFINEELQQQMIKRKIPGSPSFPHFSNLSDTSKKFSSLNKFFVFQKTLETVLEAGALKRIDEGVKERFDNIFGTTDDLYYEDMHVVKHAFIASVLKAVNPQQQKLTSKNYEDLAEHYRKYMAAKITKDFYMTLSEGEIARRKIDLLKSQYGTRYTDEEYEKKSFDEFKEEIITSASVGEKYFLEFMSIDKNINIFVLDLDNGLLPSRKFRNCSIYNKANSIILINRGEDMNYSVVYRKAVKDVYHSIFNDSGLILKIKRIIC